MTRLAIVDPDSCKSSECALECIKYCPVNRTGSDCIVLGENKIVSISEILCNGCGICVKKCPFDAITIINLPEDLDSQITHRYGANLFKLHRLPIPRAGKVVGLVGQNGAGKSTSLKILAGQIIPNLGLVDKDVSWDEVISHFKGSELQLYFDKLSKGKIQMAVKPQNIELIPKVSTGIVKDLILNVNSSRFQEHEIIQKFQLENIWDRSISQLSGGELQKVAIAATLVKDVEAYFIDEPSSFLDVKERMKMASLIRELAQEDKMLIIVEHDLTLLDYLSDYIHIYYGSPGAYGVVTQPLNVREGINIFLDGFIPSENMRFRDVPIKFQRSELSSSIVHQKDPFIRYGAFTKSYDSFTFSNESGELYSGDIVGIIGPNGIGKTTFVKMIAGVLDPTTKNGDLELLHKRVFQEEEEEEQENESDIQPLKIKLKPQYLVDYSESEKTVLEYINSIDPTSINSAFLKTELFTPLNIDAVLNRELKTLSGGELQKVVIMLTLIDDADLYLFDEPSAFISAEDRVRVAKAIRRITLNRKSTAIVIEHDLLLQTYISDRIIYFSGEPGKTGKASSPLSIKEGMNTFLKDQSITFRTDPDTKRPRVNKLNSKLDKLQKSQGIYYET